MSDYMARDSDKQRGLLFLALFIATAVVALALPHLTDISLYEASALLAVPFIVLGVLDMAVARRWLPLVSCLVIPAVLYLVSWEFSFAALALLCIVFAIIAFLAWARPITHAPRNADAVPLRGRYAPHRQ